MKMAPLGEVAEIVSGATPKTSGDDYWGGDIFWATPADLSRLDGAYISSTARTITTAGLRSCAAQVLPAGSVLLSSRAPIGHVAINTEPMATNQGFKSLIPQPDRVEPKYLYHWLRANKTLLQSLGNGATFKEISKAVVSRIEIPLPPLDEQRRIAAILDGTDELRARRAASISILDELVRSLFSETSESQPAEPTPLPDAFWFQEGPGIRKWQFTETGVKLLNVGNITPEGRLDLSKTQRYISTDEAKGRYKHFLVDSGDLVIASSGISFDSDGLLRTRGAFVRDLELPLCMNTSTIRFKAKQGRSNLTYLKSWLDSSEFRSQISSLVTGSAQKNFGPSHLGKLRITLPPLSVQHIFADQVRRIEAHRLRCLQLLAETEKLSFCLQSRAFSGQL